MANGDRLSLKQLAFIDYYIETLNAAKAAEMAGYSKKTARFIGAENLTKPNIKAAIDERLAELQDARIAKVDEVMIYLTSVMRRELNEFVPVKVSTQHIEQVEVSFNPETGETKTKPVVLRDERVELVKVPPQLSDSNKAAELLGKRYKLWTDKVEATIDSEIIVRMEGLEDLNK